MRALKRLSHRHWPTLRDLWVDHLPQVDFATTYPQPTLSEIPAIEYPVLNAGGTSECDYVGGVREAILRETLLLSRKFIYCGMVLPILSVAGKNTWTALAAYEASFYGAKTICYLLGFASMGKNSNLYLDAFCERQRKVGKTKSTVYDLMRVHRLDERLTHQVLWKLTERLLDTTVFEIEDLVRIQTQLKILDWESFTSFRNSIYYDSSFWPLSVKYDLCDLVRDVQHPDVKLASKLQSINSVAPFAEEYFVVATLLRQLIVGMLQSIADIAPALKPEVQAFDVLPSA